MKKTWETPKLIVLVRNNPPEAVLSFCKGGTGALIAAIGPTTTDIGCTEPPAMANGPICAECDALSTS